MNRAIPINRFLPLVLAGCTFVGYLVGSSRAPDNLASAQRQAGYPQIPLAPDQGEPVHWSADHLRNVHNELAARANGQVLSQPFDLTQLPFTRTHFFNIVHRPPSAEPTAEQHEGVTDIYFVIGGSGSVTVGGEIEDRRASATRPGEYYGRLRGGQTYPVKAGDVLSVPPDVPHASSGDPGGLTYMLLKVNVGLYPWSLVAGAR